jgi:hypothetical protein
MDPNGFPFGKQLDGGICTNCTVLAAKADVVFANGTRADVSSGVYLHHVISSLAGKTQPQWVSRCPAGASIAPPAGADINKLVPGGLDLSKLDLSKLRGGAGFAGGAVDEFTDLYTSPDGKFDSGYYIPPGVKASMSGELINYLKEEQQVFVQFDVEFVPGHVGHEAIKAALSVEGRLSLSYGPSDSNRMQLFQRIRIWVQERNPRHGLQQTIRRYRRRNYNLIP